ncbi:MAG: FadR family transcriptional regulator [Mesosutterella sp.]|nr:FadR family transcriptional regulator [Mesosutterella sp.]
MKQNVPSLGTYVYNELLKKISSPAAFPAGARLPSEERLAQEFKVSRPIVREALSQLREDGIIQSRRGAGSFIVRKPQPLLPDSETVDNWNDLLQGYEYRSVLESNIAYLAALRATTEDKESIRRAYLRVINEYHSNTDGTAPGTDSDMDRDTAFHMAVARATHNHYYVEALQALLDQMKATMLMIVKIFSGNPARHIQILTDEHSWIVNAILYGNPEQAKAAMMLHIQNARDSILPTELTNKMQGLPLESRLTRR